MSDTPFQGMRGADDFLSTEILENWRQGILRLFPNAMVPLTALTALMASESTPTVTYNWHTKTLPTQRAVITGLYTNSALSTAYTTGGVAGQTLYVKMGSETEGKRFRPGHQVLLRDADDYSVDINAKVNGVVLNGASTYLSVSLLEADDNGVAIAGTTHNLANADTVLIIGNINADGGTRPQSISYTPLSANNQCQIFRNSLDITRRAMKTTLRTGDAYQELKLDTLQDHSLEMEKAFMFGVDSTFVGDNGKDETTTLGLIPAIKKYAPANCVDYRTYEDAAGKTWLQGGEDWIDAMIEQIFRDGNVESRLVFCGSGALAGINKLVKANGNWTLTPKMTSYGFGVTEWQTVFGTINLKTHPLFSFEETNRYSMVAFVPEDLRYRYIDDTDFYPDGAYQKGGNDGKDAKGEEWLTDAGLEFHFPSMTGYFNGVGQDNVLSAG